MNIDTCRTCGAYFPTSSVVGVYDGNICNDCSNKEEEEVNTDDKENVNG